MRLQLRLQRGFTLLELMVAMSIFAALAVAGWQVFDSVNRARERAQYHADQLAVLQYAYLQLQQDMGQIIAYQVPSIDGNSNVNNSSNANNNNNSANDNSANNSNSQTNANLVAKPFMRLNGEQVSFVRFADPDPRYQSSPSLQRVDYVFANQRLIRRQYPSLGRDSDSVSLDTVLLDGLTEGRWQAYLPDISPIFPNDDMQDGDNNTANDSGGETAQTLLLPKGIAVSFTYEEIPITWQFALAPQPLAHTSNNFENTPQ